MKKKQMSITVKRSTVNGRFKSTKGGERLRESIVGSLRVEGYEVEHEKVAEVLSQRQK